jgi:uracil-DNA glycosylase
MGQAAALDRYTVTLDALDDFDGWRDAVRAAVAGGIAPDRIVWQVAGGEDDLFGSIGSTLPRPAASAPPFSLPGSIITLIRAAILHRDPERFALLHRLVAGIASGAIGTSDLSDPVRARVEALARSVRRDIHKMRAFVRFREATADDASSRYVAWFEPDHHIVRANARFFIDRFASMHWSILTPEVSVHWDGKRLTEGPGATRGDAPSGDPVEDAWKRYYASIFNPARVKIGAMMKEMPKKYWANMPETALIGELVAGAQGRVTAMLDASRADSAA